MSTPRSTRRQRQREETRIEILNVARGLFAEQGYAATSMATIAKSAGVAIQTIYDSVGSKAEILVALTAFIEQPVAGIWEKSATTVDAKEMLALAIGLTRTINEQSGDILMLISSTALTEPSVADALHQGQGLHIEGTRKWIEMMDGRGMLHPGVTVNYAAATLGILTFWTVWRELTVEFGFSFDGAEEWITDSLSRLILPDASR